MAFRPGQSGNPNGRPKGRADKRVSWRAALEPHGDELIAKAIELAMGGDPQALRMCLDRLAPSIKPQAEPVMFELKGDNLTQQAQSVLAAVADGELDPITGKALIDSLSSIARITEIDEITRRLDQLEANNG